MKLQLLFLKVFFTLKKQSITFTDTDRTFSNFLVTFKSLFTLIYEASNEGGGKGRKGALLGTESQSIQSGAGKEDIQC